MCPPPTPGRFPATKNEHTGAAWGLRCGAGCSGQAPGPWGRLSLCPVSTPGHPPVLGLLRNSSVVFLLLLMLHGVHVAPGASFRLLRRGFLSGSGCLVLGFSFLGKVTEPQFLGPASKCAPERRGFRQPPECSEPAAASGVPTTAPRVPLLIVLRVPASCYPLSGHHPRPLGLGTCHSFRRGRHPSSPPRLPVALPGVLGEACPATSPRQRLWHPPPRSP